MKLLKTTIIFRSTEALYNFNKTSDKTFWEKVESEFKALFPEFVFERKGSFQGYFYFPSDTPPEEAQAKISAVLKTLLGSEKDVINVTGYLSETDFAYLKKSNISDINNKHWFSSDAVNPQENPTPSAPKAAEVRSEDKEAEDIPISGTGKKADTAENIPSGAKTAESLSLAQEAKKISALRQRLLQNVKGQRHAVETVTQAIFESDIFAARNEKRKGPLATFLFLGPSGTGKTFLAKQIAQSMGIEPKILDMSEYSAGDYSAAKLLGETGNPSPLAKYAKDTPNGIIVFDEIEKASLATIHLFLQILDEGRLSDSKTNKTIDLSNMIVIITTNAGHSLYEDASVCDLSGVSRRVILDALRTDKDPQTRQPYFPDCLTTRFANGNIVLFNHLEPYSLMTIIRDELDLQVELFKKANNVEVSFDKDLLAALVLYHAGGIADARTLQGLARSTISSCLQEMVMQTFEKFGDNVDLLKNIRIEIDEKNAPTDVQDLFSVKKDLRIMLLADSFICKAVNAIKIDNVTFLPFDNDEDLKAAARGVADLVMIDPAFGMREMDQVPTDIEDISSVGMDMFLYMKEFYPELPIYVLDTRHSGESTFKTLLANGARGVVAFELGSQDGFTDEIRAISLGSLINNNAYALGRSGKVLNYNCSQYTLNYEQAVISFSRLSLHYAPSSNDKDIMLGGGSTKFDDVIGCKSAIEDLKELCGYLSNPREMLARGLQMPKGILFYGPPGTGKTMMAKALANEANVPFIPTTATSFFNPYVGQTEINIREMFARARRYAPSIIFIDEVDAIARARQGGIGSKYNEDALTTFLSEMDGFKTDPSRPVFIVAATNYEISGDSGTVLDAAFVRRFDKRIYVGLPDTEARFTFLKKSFARHLIGFGAEEDKLLRNAAARSGGMSNADLANVVSLFMRRINKGEKPSGGLLMDVLDAFRFGETNKTDPNSLLQTAYHESGHAIIAHMLEKTPAYLTVVSRSNFGGFMEHDTSDTKSGYTFNELMALVCCSLGGRAAEIEVYGDELGVNTGATSDIKHARYLIKTALKDYAMGKNLFSDFPDAEAESLMQDQMTRARKLLAANRPVLDKLAHLLAQEKSLDQNRLEEFFNQTPCKNDQ